MSMSNDCIECILIELRSKCVSVNCNIIIGIIYRPLNTDTSVFNEHLGTVRIASNKADK